MLSHCSSVAQCFDEKNASKHLALRASLLACIDIGL